MALIHNLVARFRAETAAFDRKVKTSKKHISAFTKTTTAAGTALKTAFAGVGAIYGIKTILKSAMAFEKQMAMVSTMLDKQTMRFMPAYSMELKKLAVQFGESTETLSKGLYDILSASIAPQKAIKVLTASVKAAKAGFTTTAVAADAITTVLNSYGLEAEHAIRVSDILFATVKRGKTTFVELAPSIGKVAAIANVAGLSLEELGAAIAAMTRGGLQTDIAITSLRSVVTQFIKPTAEAKEAAAAFGLELSSASLKSLGLSGALKKLSRASADQLAKIIPNVRGLAGFATVLKQVERHGIDVQLMMDSMGRTQEAYDKATDTLEHSTNQLWESLKLLGVEIGTKVSPRLIEMIQNLREAGHEVERFRQGFIQTHKDFETMIGLRESGPLLLDQKSIAERWQEKQIAESPLVIEAEKYAKILKEQAKEQEVVKSITNEVAVIVENYTNLIQREIDLTGKVGKAHWHAAKMIEFENDMKKAGIIDTDMLAKAYKQVESKLKELEKVQRLSRIAKDIGDSFADAFTDMIFEAKKFGEVFRALMKDIAKSVMTNLVTQPIGLGISGMIGGMFPAKVGHSGGIVGSIGRSRNVPAMAFAGAPRLHSGLMTDEFPTILQRGEQVIPKGGGYAPTIIINNQSGQPMRQERESFFDGRQWVVKIVADNIQNGGILRKMVQS